MANLSGMGSIHLLLPCKIKSFQTSFILRKIKMFPLVLGNGFIEGQSSADLRIAKLLGKFECLTRLGRLGCD